MVGSVPAWSQAQVGNELAFAVGGNVSAGYSQSFTNEGPSSNGLIFGGNGKGDKRTTPLHPEAVERLVAWLRLPGIRDDAALPLFRPHRHATTDATASGHGR